MLETGISIPVHASALGKVLLTYHDEQAASVLSHSLRALTGDTITDPEQLRTQLTEVGRVGLAFERDEAVIGESSVAAPVVDRDDQIGW